MTMFILVFLGLTIPAPAMGQGGPQVQANVSGSNGMYTVTLTVSDSKPFYLYYTKPVAVVCSDGSAGLLLFPMATAYLMQGGATQHSLEFSVSLNTQTTYELYTVLDGNPVKVGEINVDNPAATANPPAKTLDCGGDLLTLALSNVSGTTLTPVPDKVELYKPGVKVDDEQSIPKTWNQLVEATQVDYKFMVATYVVHPMNVLVFGAGAPPKEVKVSPEEPTTLQVSQGRAILYILALETGPGNTNTTVTGVVGPLNLTNARDVVNTVSVVIDGQQVFNSSLSGIYEEQGMKDKGLVIGLIVVFIVAMAGFLYYMNKRG